MRHGLKQDGQRRSDPGHQRPHSSPQRRSGAWLAGQGCPALRQGSFFACALPCRVTGGGLPPGRGCDLGPKAVPGAGLSWESTAATT